MKRIIPYLASFAILAGPCAALDLTPVPGFRELEGMKIPILTFSDGVKKISYQPPRGWRASGIAETLTLHPPNFSGAVVEFRVRARKAGVLENPEEWSRSLLPQDAREPAITSKVESPFTLGMLASSEYTFTYAAQGRRFAASVAVVDLNEKERLALIVTALPNDFKAVRDEAIRSMFSWNWRN